MLEPTPPSAKARWRARRPQDLSSSPSAPSPTRGYALSDGPSLGSVLPDGQIRVRSQPSAVPRRVPRAEPLFLPNDGDDEEDAYRPDKVYAQGEGEEGRNAGREGAEASAGGRRDVTEARGRGIRAEAGKTMRVRPAPRAPVGQGKRRRLASEVHPVEEAPEEEQESAVQDSDPSSYRQTARNAQARYDPVTPPRRAPARPIASQLPATGIDEMARRLQDEEEEIFVPVELLSPRGGNVATVGLSVDEDGEGAVGGEAEAQWDEQTILSLHCPNGYNVAAAVWEPEGRKLLVMEDTKDTTGFDLAALVVEQVQPQVIIMSARCQNELYNRVKKYCDETDGAKILLQVHASFSERQTISALSQARLPGDHGYVQAGHQPSDDAMTEADTLHDDDADGGGLGKFRMALLRLGCRVNMEAPAALTRKKAAAGGLLVYIQKQKVLSSNFDGEPGVILDGIEALALNEHMLINQDALTSLGIFDIESHAFSNSDTKKQALSIFGLLNTCATTAGKRLFHTWHLRPLISLQDIADRHDAVEGLSAPDNSHGAKIMKKYMNDVRNVCRVMKLLRKGDGKVRDWKTLTNALMAFMMIRDQILGITHTKPIPAIEKVIRSIDGSMPVLAQLIMSTIDWDRSLDEERVCIRRGIDQQLDAKREELAELEGHLDAISHKIAQIVDPNFYQDLKVVYLPQLGFLTAISPAQPDVPAPMGWQSAFSTEHTQYFKNPQMRNMDDHYGDIESVIQGIELDIVQELIDKLRDVDVQVTVANDAIAELDCLIALSEAAIVYNLKRPEMVARPVLRIRDGRHLLQEQLTDTYIANDTAIEGGEGRQFSSMMIVTGANGSGKSIYGKQVALIAFMAQIGSFVPATWAQIGVVDKIFTRLQTKESAGRTGSAFMIDLSQVAMALRGATERSLLILDEFGKGMARFSFAIEFPQMPSIADNQGTTSTDGAGLLAAVIEHLQQGHFPRTIVLTHFHELFAQHIIPQIMNSVIYCHMRSILQADRKRLTYQYKLEPGRSHTSNAAECALMYGMPEDVIDRAMEITELVATSNIAKIYEQELDENDYDEYKAAEELAMRLLAWDIDEKYDVKLQLEDMLDQFDEDMRKMLQDDGTRQESTVGPHEE